MSVTVEEALRIIYAKINHKSIKILPLEQALGFILAQNITASQNLPPFDNSAMDGYAVKLEDSNRHVRVNHTIFAGDDSNETLACGFAIKIMTGARIPHGTQSIVPIEDITIDTDGINLPDNLKLSKHIRFCGEDIKCGDIILTTGTKIDAHAITLLASQGISHIKVYKKPRVAIFASGSELKMHFEKLESHQLYNTNTPTIFARVQELGCEVNFIGTASDTLEDLQLHIQSALDSDLIITSGGVSVGDADFTKEAFEPFGHQIYFDKIEIKPGKPTTFGRVKDTYVLNLPGNPLAAFLNFELFGQSIILALSGNKAKYLNTITAKMKHDFKLKASKRTLLPGYFDGEFFNMCEKFAPGMISPLAISNSFIMVDEACEFLACGNNVKIIPTKFSFTSCEQKSLISFC